MAHSAYEQPHNSGLIHAAKQSALEMGTEDIHGFWELLWAMKLSYSGNDPEILLDACQEALTHLAQHQLVRVVWWDPATDSDTDLTPDEAIKLIQEREYWDPPQGDLPSHPRFIATRSGDRAYYAGLTVPS